MQNGKKNPSISIGFRTGKLTVESATSRRKNGYIVWKCLCDCGNTVELDTRCLQRGAIKSCGCGCAVRPGMLDLTGKRFGKLVCLSLYPEKTQSGGTQWLCKCDCGNTCVAALHQLRAGYKKSCGCLSREVIKDYVGHRFGNLTVIEYAEKSNGMHRWKCLCDCGNITVVGQTNLQSGRTKSCGCLKRNKKTDKNHKGFVDGTNIGTLRARMSKPPISTNTSGYNGVYPNALGKWTAQITFKGKTYYLGSFSDIRDAAHARKNGEKLYKEFLDNYVSESE